MSKKTPWSLWTHTQYSQRMAPHAPHLKQPSRYMLVTPARMGVVSRHSIQLMSWPYQCPVIVDVAAIKSFRDPTHGIVRGHDCGHASVPSSTSTAPCRLSSA